MATCSRRGCEKKLRSNNTTGHCGSGCHSLDAPPSQQDRRVTKAAPAAAAPAAPDAMARFRVVVDALGHDPDAILADFAQLWLDELRKSSGA